MSTIIGPETVVSNQPVPAADETFSAAPMPAIRRFLEVAGWVVVTWLVLVGLISIVGRAGFLANAIQLAPVDSEAVLGPFDFRYYEHPVATVLHLIPALAVVLLGPLQFTRRIRNRHIRLHRWSGYIFISCGVIGAFSGIVLGVFNPFMGVAGQGFNESMATAFFSAYTLFVLCMALDRIRRRMIPQHREWMIRSWAILLAVATERTILTLLQATTDIDMAVLFGTTFWMAAVINIAVAEAWINLTRTPGKGTRHWKDADARALVGD